MVRFLLAAWLAASLVPLHDARGEQPGRGTHPGASSGNRPGRSSWATASGGIGSWNGERYQSPGGSNGGGYYFRAGSAWYLPYDSYGALIDYGALYPAPPVLVPYQPEIYQPFPAGDPQLQQLIDEQRGAVDEPAVTFPVEELPKRFVQPSTPAAKLRSVRLEHEGDLQLQDLQFAVAARRYREALAAAEDRPEPYFRLAFAEAALGDFSEAVRLYKLGLQLDPAWPDHGESLNDLLGQQNLLGKTQVKQRVAEWTSGNVRDPDRLFLLGVLLHKDETADKARILFETAALLSGGKPYLTAFLDAASAPQGAGQKPVPPHAEEAPPPPAPDGAGLAPAPLPTAGLPAPARRLLPPPPAAQ
jgi:tetratricopeptide (TPR) repeat protein